MLIGLELKCICFSDIFTEGNYLSSSLLPWKSKHIQGGLYLYRMEMGSALTGKNLHPLGATSFLSELTPRYKGRQKRKWQHCFPGNFLKVYYSIKCVCIYRVIIEFFFFSSGSDNRSRGYTLC